MVSLHLKKFSLEKGKFCVLKPNKEITRQAFVEVIPAARSWLDGETVEFVGSVDSPGATVLVLESTNFGIGKQESNSKRKLGYGTTW